MGLSKYSAKQRFIPASLNYKFRLCQEAST